MKVSKKIISGIYKYEKDITYTEGDLILSDAHTLFRVKREVVGLDPLDNYPEYFEQLFSTAQVATEEDLNNYLNGNNPDVGDKVVPLELMLELLDKICCGISSTGNISNFIRITDGEIPNEIGYSDFFGNINSTSCSTDPLDVVLKVSELNNAHFVVDKTILENLLQSRQLHNEITVDGILHQYTYTSLRDNREETIRVQELVEPANGILLYRYSVSPDGISFVDSNTSSWKGQYSLSSEN